jgi:hypothetical protein
MVRSFELKARELCGSVRADLVEGGEANARAAPVEFHVLDARVARDLLLVHQLPPYVSDDQPPKGPPHQLGSGLKDVERAEGGADVDEVASRIEATDGGGLSIFAGQ